MSPIDCGSVGCLNAFQCLMIRMMDQVDCPMRMIQDGHFIDLVRDGVMTNRVPSKNIA